MIDCSEDIRGMIECSEDIGAMIKRFSCLAHPGNKIPDEPRLLFQDRIEFITKMVVSELSELMCTTDISYGDQISIVLGGLCEKYYIRRWIKYIFIKFIYYMIGILLATLLNSGLYLPVLTSQVILVLLCSTKYRPEVPVIMLALASISLIYLEIFPCIVFIGFWIGLRAYCEPDDSRSNAINLDNSLEVRNIITAQADALADIVYYIYDTGFRYAGYNVSDIVKEVHKANMNKRFPDGTFHRREDGKIIKPTGWMEPDLYKILFPRDSI